MPAHAAAGKLFHDIRCCHSKHGLLVKRQQKYVKPCMLHERKCHERCVLLLAQALVDEGEAGLLPAVMAAFARPTRIVRGKDVDSSWRVDADLFDMGEECALWDAFSRAAGGISASMGIREFLQVCWPGLLRSAQLILYGVLTLLAKDPFLGSSMRVHESWCCLCGGTLKTYWVLLRGWQVCQALVGPMDAYFDSVFVMCEDESIRRNRLAMLRDIAALPSGIVNFAQLPGF